MRWITRLLLATLSVAFLLIATLAISVILAWPRLPTLDALTDYRPKVPLRVYTADGYLLSEFGEERRTLIGITQIPQDLKNAILAAEDQRFYEHPGIDVIGLFRAALANFISGRHSQGASTITMQVARNFFLSREKTYNRKFYEILLSLKIEHNLSKDQILELYVNQIFLGHRSHGFAAAAKTYFGKDVANLTLAEAAMLAGIPKSPSNKNPITNFKGAISRQHHVLSRMLEAGYIDAQRYEIAKAAAIQLATYRDDKITVNKSKSRTIHGEYVAEMARQIVSEQFGDAAQNMGLRVITTITRADQIAAYNALRSGVINFDRHHRYRGPEKYIDLSPESIRPEDLDYQLSQVANDAQLLPALVLQASPKKVIVYREGEKIEISGSGLKFARAMLSPKAPQDKQVRRGAIVRIYNRGDKKGWEITQIPDIEAAFVSLDPKTGAVKALIGGFDFNRNQFNNVTQAFRQPGSSFKPFIYSAALEEGFSPGSYIDDEPLYFPPGVTGKKAWEPKNYDGSTSGPITMRNALTRSKNLVSIRLLQSVTPRKAQQYITRFGFSPEQHPPFLTMALGAGSATPWQMAGAYAVFANGGYKVSPYIIHEIIDSEGRTIARTNPATAGKSAPRVIDARNAWLMDSMMRDVVQYGTARRARALNRQDLAGKTGTTNDYVDAWFTGYQPDLVGVAWIGYGQPHSMGRGGTGSRSALPIWIDYMKTALKKYPQRRLPRPSGLLTVHHPGEARSDFYYKENPPPAPKPLELPDIPELRYFMPEELEQPLPPAGTQLPPPGTPLTNETPAPVIDLVPTPTN